MLAANLGQILAVAGFVLLLLNRVGGRRSWRHGPSGNQSSLKWRRWADLGGFGLIVAGLVVMAAMK